MKSSSQLRRALLAGSATAAAVLVLHPQDAQAEDCLLDRNNDGQVTVATTYSNGYVNSAWSPDNDAGSTSADNDEKVACGAGANASGHSSTAIGAWSYAPVAVADWPSPTAPPPGAVDHAPMAGGA